MKKMTNPQVKAHWAGLQKQHRAQISETVITLYLPGRAIQELADLLDYSNGWIYQQISTYAVIDFIRDHVSAPVDWMPAIVGMKWEQGFEGASKQLSQIIRENRPTTIDLELAQDYERELEVLPAIAERLASAYRAAESALNRGQIRIDESGEKAHLQPDKKPEDRKKTFAADFISNVGKMKKLIHLLNDATPAQLRSKRVQETVKDLNADWRMIVELVEHYASDGERIQ